MIVIDFCILVAPSLALSLWFLFDVVASPQYAATDPLMNCFFFSSGLIALLVEVNPYLLELFFDFIILATGSPVNLLCNDPFQILTEDVKFGKFGRITRLVLAGSFDFHFVV